MGAVNRFRKLCESDLSRGIYRLSSSLGERSLAQVSNLAEHRFFPRKSERQGRLYVALKVTRESVPEGSVSSNTVSSKLFLSHREFFFGDTLDELSLIQRLL